MKATGAAAAYVGMTRGRNRNTAHLVAETLEEARAQWVDVFSRDRADLGPRHAAQTARRGHRPLRTSGPAPSHRTRRPHPAPRSAPPTPTLPYLARVRPFARHRPMTSSDEISRM